MVTGCASESDLHSMHVGSQWSRRHGFQCPWGLPQIFSMSVYGFNAALFLGKDITQLNVIIGTGAAVFISIAMVGLLIATFVLGYIVIRANPSDPVIAEERRMRELG